MRLKFPISLLFFVATGVVLLLQMIPVVGIFLMFMLAMFWSVLLVNAGMVGIAIEALIGRVSRGWAIIPIIFYAGYWMLAVSEHKKLEELSAFYVATNNQVAIPFSPNQQSLAFSNSGNGAWFTQNYSLPVAYSTNSNFPEGYLSNRMMDHSVCQEVRKRPALRAAFVHAFGFHDGDAIGDRKMEKRFCAMSMPERPELPIVQIAKQEKKIFEGSLPVTRITTTVTTPDGQRFQLLGGFAAPLSWLPMPVMGCGLNSGAPSWDCGAQFWRKGFTPIVSGNTKYSRDSVVLANALGLKNVSKTDRIGGDPNFVRAKMEAVESSTLERQLFNMDAMIEDPFAKVNDWQVGVVASRPEVLSSKAEDIMTGIERAVKTTKKNRYRARESGRILARLIAKLPKDQFVQFGPRLLAIYAKADDEHWLWESETLLRRLGDLGIEALPYLVNPRASRSSVNGAGIEGLCRVGSAGRTVAEPALLGLWKKSRDGFDRDARFAMFVAMRRIGVSPPPLSEDKRGDFSRMQKEWADISPQSPSRVCAVRAEKQARREEKFSGERRTNIN